MFTIIIILSDTELFSLQQHLIFAIIYFIKTENQHYLIYIDWFEDFEQNFFFFLLIINCHIA